MIELIRNTNQKARKNYSCDCCDHLNQDLNYYLDEMTFTEKKAVVRARKNNWRIMKGHTYTKQVGKFDGVLYTHRAIPEIADICDRLDVYGSL